MEQYIKPGVYKHFKKGGLSLVLSAAKHSETGEVEVVYIGMEDKTFHIRPAESFFGMATNAQGQNVPRFVFEREMTSQDEEFLLSVVKGQAKEQQKGE